jgi:phosphoglycerate kinase
MEFKTLDNLDLENKTVFVRVDLNCPIKNKKPILSQRIKEHSKTIAYLIKQKAKVVILSHQGRKGDKDFTSLKNHKKLLEHEVKKFIKNSKILFVDDVCSKKAIDAIKSLKPAQALLLENTRFLDCETDYEKTKSCVLVDALEPLCDIFVLDALSVAHRAHASVVGFKKPIRVAGKVLEEELKALKKFQDPPRPCVLILGGAKISDSIDILYFWAENNKADYFLVGGLFSVELLKASDILKNLDLANAIDNQTLQKLSDLYLKFQQKIILPSDVVLNVNNKPVISSLQDISPNSKIFDIGPKSTKKYLEYIKNAGSIILNGPMGVYEQKGFEKGTKEILVGISKSKAFSLLGGGNTTDALNKFKISAKKFGYVSLSGKALIEYLTKGQLVGIDYLEGKDF